VGADVQLRVTAFNASGQVLSNVPITFTSSAEGVATVSAAGVLGANAIGNVTITARVTTAPVKATATIRVAPVVMELPFPQGANHVEIYGVNDARTVVGASYFANGDPPRAFAYTPSRGSVNLAVLNPSEPIPSQARGVNASGVITGYATRSGGLKRVVTWTPTSQRRAHIRTSSRSLVRRA
jgi:probable HAF family extracellular repeat protein